MQNTQHPWEQSYPKYLVASQNIKGQSSGLPSPPKPVIHDIADDGIVKRGLIRQLIMILDASSASLEKDFYPSRWEVIMKGINLFIQEYFEQVPISQLGFILTQDGKAKPLSHYLSTDAISYTCYHSAKSCLEGINMMNLHTIELKGNPSLQNSLILAHHILNSLSSKAVKEILIIYTGLTTCDPGSIIETIKKLKEQSIRVSVISLTAELYICKEICKETRGRFSVSLNEQHFYQLLFSFASPFPLIGQKSTAKLVRMGFPKRISSSSICLCHCKNLSNGIGYLCPQCNSIVCDLPIDCPICFLTLVSPIHLIRSHHHLFPLERFIEKIISNSRCFSCQEMISTNQNTECHECSLCKNIFCSSCYLLLHDSIHACPGCIK